MDNQEKIVEQRNSELMLANLGCIRKLKLHISKN